MAEKRCALCQRPPNEVKALLGGPNGPWICDRCTTSAWETLVETQNKSKPKKKDEKPLLKPREINAYLDEHVISQTKAKQDVAVAIYNHYKRREAIRRGLKYECEIQKSNILILGPSGTGKTEIARAIAKMLGVPFHNADATKMTASGYVGQDVESMIKGVLQDADGDIERAQWGICFLDECDKIARKSGRDGSHYRDVGGEAVQQSLLKMVEGTKVVVPRGLGLMVGQGSESDLVDTTNILFIFAGSFAGIEDVVRKRMNKNVRLGFGSDVKKELDLKDVYSSIEEEDILEFGIIPELLGRLPVHTSTLPLTDDEMVQVLTQPKNAIIKQFKALYDMDGIDLQFDDGALRAIAQEAQKRPTGARALRSILERILRPYSFDYPSELDVEAVRITEEVVKKTGEAIVVNGDRRKKKPEPPPVAAQG